MVIYHFEAYFISCEMSFKFFLKTFSQKIVMRPSISLPSETRLAQTFLIEGYADKNGLTFHNNIHKQPIEKIEFL